MLRREGSLLHWQTWCQSLAVALASQPPLDPALAHTARLQRLALSSIDDVLVCRALTACDAAFPDVWACFASPLEDRCARAAVQRTSIAEVTVWITTNKCSHVAHMSKQCQDSTDLVRSISRSRGLCPRREWTTCTSTTDVLIADALFCARSNPPFAGTRLLANRNGTTRAHRPS